VRGSPASQCWTSCRTALVASSAMTGMIMAIERRVLVRRQAAVIMILSAPLMLLQVSGAGAWTQVLTTHGIIGEESVSKEGMPTLFVPAPISNVTNVQTRPAGFLHASEFASLIILFALVLLLTSRGRRQRPAEAATCAAAVLSMAKIVLLTAGVAIAWGYIIGDSRFRQRARACAIWLTVFLLLYRVVFPGLFDANLGADAFAFSLLSRAYDVASVLGYGSLVDQQLYQVLHQSMNVAEGETLSGIGQIVRYLPYFGAVAVLGAIPFIVAFRRMRRLSPAAVQLASTMTICILLFLVAAPFLSSPVFWFCMGFGLFPLLTLADRNYLRHSLRLPTAPPPGINVRLTRGANASPGAA
jgi:hypothetical protein